LIRNARMSESSFGHAGLAGVPARGVAIVTCMDARIDPMRLLGFAAGDAHVMRNAGGVVTDDVIRSLSVSQHLLATREIMLIMHTQCGMLTPEAAAFRRTLEAETGFRPTWAAEAFTDLDTEVRQSLARLRASPFLSHPAARGFVYDVRTGHLREVE
jgi:carbonic anhydrase